MAVLLFKIYIDYIELALENPIYLFESSQMYMLFTVGLSMNKKKVNL